MEFAKFVEWAFYGIIGGCAVVGVKSLLDLNVNIAVIIERIANHDKRLDKAEEQIEELKNQ